MVHERHKTYRRQTPLPCQTKNRYFTTFLFPWGRLCGNHAKRCMNETERQFSASQTPRSMYPSIYLCKAGVPTRDIVYIYCPVIRSVLEYACPVWHPGLTSKLSKDIGRVQKRCLRIIFPQCCHILKPWINLALIA